MGVEQQEVDDVRNKWTGLFESFEWPRCVESIGWQRQSRDRIARPDQKPEHQRIKQQRQHS